MLVSHYKIKCSAFIPQNYDYYLIIISWHTDLCVPPWQELKNCHSRNKAFAFAAIHEVPFEPPHCCGIGDILCIASGFQSYLCAFACKCWLIIPKVTFRAFACKCWLIIPKGADQSCKMFLCLKFGYQEVHTGNDTFTAVRMAKRVHISHFHKYVFTDHV
jgi:hypothetical protein